MINTYWNISPEMVAEALDTDILKGLSIIEVEKRLNKYGKNILKQKHQQKAFTIFISQFTSPLIFVLVIAGFITLFVSHFQDALFIFMAVVINACLGFYQEYKADRAISALSKYVKHTTKVIRGGQEMTIDSEDVVIGDIVKLTQGERIPADGKLIFVNDFQVDESIVTGESLAVEKTVGIDAQEAVLGDRLSSVLAGALIIQGKAKMMVCHTGTHTEFGKIASLIDDELHDETPLQKKIKRFSIQLSALIGVLVIGVFAIGVLFGYPIGDMTLTALAVAISAIPESLPIAMTVILAIGVERMAKRKGVIKKLVAAETLGSTTVILTDKTGTLTKAQMELTDMYVFDQERSLQSNFDSISQKSELIERAIVNTDISVENPDDKPEQWIMDGKIMEVALIRGLAKYGHELTYLQNKDQVIQTLPFNPTHKFSVSLIERDGGYELVFFGAPDILLQFTNWPEAEKQKAQKVIGAKAEQGQRLLGIAHKAVSGISDISQLHHVYEQGITLDGLLAFKDPIRDGVKDTMYRLEHAGIRTVIMTGDHEGTATAIAKDIGIFAPGSVLDVSILHTLKESEIKKRLSTVRVISRVTPEDKQHIVKLFQANGEVVAMTGDGVNDSPSIKTADVGIAMGSGTEVCRNVADVVLLDDNFETIVAAVEEGRQIMKNIRKALVYLLSNIADSILLIGGSILIGLPLPINALQMLWVNFFSDSFPALAYAFEKEKNVFLGGVVDRSKGLFTPTMQFITWVIGGITSSFLFVLYMVLVTKGYDLALVRTFIFAAFGTYTLFVALSVRSLEQSIFTYSFISNPAMLGGVGIGFGLMYIAVYTPFMQGILGTIALPPIWLAGVILVGVINIVLIECSKLLYRRAR